MVERILFHPKEDNIIGTGWEGIGRWLRWVSEQLPSKSREALKEWLRKERLVGPGFVLTSTSPLRLRGLAVLSGREPRIFNGRNIRELLRDVPKLAYILADSVGAKNLEELLAYIFNEVNFLGLVMPNQPYGKHLLVRSGVVNNEDFPHPVLMARWKVFGLELFLRLAGIPSREWPVIVGLDTVSALKGLTPSQLRYYGVPSYLDHRVIYLDKLWSLERNLRVLGGIGESHWPRVLKMFQGPIQLRRSEGRQLTVVTGGAVWKPGNDLRFLLNQQSFRPLAGEIVAPNLSVPGGVDTKIGPGGESPLSHLGGRGVVGGRLFNYPPLGPVREAFNDPTKLPSLARMMMAVRGFPGWELLEGLGLGGQSHREEYMEVISHNPQLWMNHVWK